MLEFAAIVPHSPLLSSRISHKQVIPTKANDLFASFANTLQEKDIHHIVSLGSHPRFERGTFSCYIADEYSIGFAEFGDLITQSSVKVWQEGFHQLREQSRKEPLELLSQGNIDYTHGIPLIQLASNFEPGYAVDFLAVNTSTNKTEEEQHAFGKYLRETLDALNQPYAIICSGDLYATTDQSQSKVIHAENKQVKRQLEESLEFKLNNALSSIETIKPPTLASTLPVLKGMIEEKPFTVEESLYETIIQTSFYFAEVTL